MSTVLFEERDRIATITLNRPHRLNAITVDLVDELNAALERGMRSEQTAVLILTGAGDRAFCAGDDLIEPPPSDEAELRRQVESIQNVTRHIVFGPKLVIGAINGWAVGGGLEWVANCDFSIWSESARAFFPEVSLGLGVTGGVTALLPKLVGWQRAKALFFLGEKLSAREVLALGLAHAVVPPDQLMPEARALADKLARMPQRAASGLKRAIGLVHRDEIERALGAEVDAIVPLFSDAETRERIAAFGSPSGSRKEGQAR